MDITVSSRHLAVSDELRSYAEAKVGRLGKYLGGMDRAEVHFSEERNPRISAKERCEVTMHGHGHVVRARVAAFDQFAAVDLVFEKLEHQLHKLKTRLVARHQGKAHRPTSIIHTVGESAEPVADAMEGMDGQVAVAVAPPPKVVKTKEFEMVPMTVDEAIVQLEMVDHGFYVFADVASSEVLVLYRRDDGDLGLIRRSG